VYEKKVMTKAPGEALPPEIAPCKDFVMSDGFREWAVAEMRREVMGQVALSGLDRMAILKAKGKDGKPAEQASDRNGTG
jgi:hypothetical protein